LLNDIVVGCDYTVDLHAGDMIEDLEPFVIFSVTGNADVDSTTRRMIDSYGVRWATCSVPTGERPGLLYGGRRRTRRTGDDRRVRPMWPGGR